MIACRNITLPAFALAALAFQPRVADAHPHVLVNARAEIVFDQKAEITAIRNIWQFDEAFTSYAIQGLDTDGDGKLSDAELAPLAKVNVESLSEFDFFTWLTIGGKQQTFVVPTEYWLEFHGGRLTLFYTLPLKEPVAVGPRTALEIYDPEYFVAFAFLPEKTVTLDGAPEGCKAEYHAPQELDSSTAALLGSIPADQRDLPADLQAYTADLVNKITVACK
jgi:ABC-type uncharacterized transport system substrate-binding protein